MRFERHVCSQSREGLKTTLRWEMLGSGSLEFDTQGLKVRIPRDLGCSFFINVFILSFLKKTTKKAMFFKEKKKITSY